MKNENLRNKVYTSERTIFIKKKKTGKKSGQAKNPK